MKYLQAKGYRVVPVNPGEVSKSGSSGAFILGERVYSTVGEVKEHALGGQAPDMVDIFRNSEAALDITREAIAVGSKVVWMQLGVMNAEATSLAESVGCRVVQDRCPKIEFSRLFGELGWHGFNSGVISSRRRRVGSAVAQKSGTPPPNPGFETQAIHSGASPDPTTGTGYLSSLSLPLFLLYLFLYLSSSSLFALLN